MKRILSPSVAVVWVAALLAAGPPSVQAADPMPQIASAGVSAPIREAIRSAAEVETFLLAASLNFLRPDRPRFHSWPIVARGRDAEPADVDLLLPILRRAHVEARVATRPPCGFDPAYGLRFAQDGSPLDLLVDADCRHLCFLRGEERAASYIADGAADRDSLCVLIRRFFPNLQE